MARSYDLTSGSIPQHLLRLAAPLIMGNILQQLYNTVDGIIVVTSPQDLVSMIVTKAVKMAEMMHIPVLGLVENYSYFRCPDCGKEHAIFGESHIEAIAAKHGIPNTAKLPIDPAIAAACDAGRIEDVQGDWLGALADAIEGK